MAGYPKLLFPMFLLFVIALLSVSSCAGPQVRTPVQTPNISPVQPTASPPIPVSKTATTWKSDGTVSANEYTQYQKIGEIDVFTRTDGDTIRLGLMGKTTGYLAIGIDPVDKMKGADIMLGSIQGGQASVYDMYATGQFGPHPEDIKLGGTNDIIDVSGSSKDGIMTFEYARKLDTGDSKDKIIKMGDNKVMWSIGSSFDVTVHHDTRGYATLVLQ